MNRRRWAIVVLFFTASLVGSAAALHLWLWLVVFFALACWAARELEKETK